MTEVNQKSAIESGAQAFPSAQKSSIFRIALLILVAIIVIAAGHFAIRSLGGQGRTESAAKLQFGESSGRDAADVPRPPRSERGYAVASQGGPARFAAGYVSRASPEEVVQFYRFEMPRRGWTEEKSEPSADGGLPAGGVGDGSTQLRYSNAGGVLCIIIVSRGPTGETSVTVFRTPGRR